MNVFTNEIANLEMVEPIEIDEHQNKIQMGDVFFTTSSETPEEVGMSSVLTENSENMAEIVEPSTENAPVEE